MRRPAAVLLGLLLGLLGSEVLLRFTWSPPVLRSTPYQIQDPLYGSALIPGARGRIATAEYEHPFRISGQGLRGRRVFAHERPEGVRSRVLFLGDSFTFGLGSADDETFVARIDAAWPEVEVANGGANGYGTREELAVLDVLGDALRPDLAVLVFFWNDLEDITKRDAPRFGVDGDGHFRRTAPAGEAPDPLELRAGPSFGPVKDAGLYLRWFVKHGLRGLRYRYLGIKERSIVTEAQKDRAWRTFEELFDLVRLRAAELDTRLVVVSIPDHNQVDPEARIRNISPLNFDVQERLARICAERDVPFVDLLPGLRAAFERDGRELYYFADRHLTPEGNRVVAELLLPELEPHLGP